MNALDLAPVSFDALPGWSDDDLGAFWPVFLTSCRSILADAPELRKGHPLIEGQRAIARDAVAISEPAEARRFLQARFQPFLVSEPAFFTAYYRPEIEASRERTARFAEPLLARPDDLVTLGPGEAPAGMEGLAAARRVDGRLEPYATRADIDAGALGARTRPVAFVADPIEAFMIQVQGSARLILDDGTALDLTYAGRNGRPYTSIGRILVDSGEIAQEDMSLDRLKGWVRAAGQGRGEPGRALLHRNESFVFFAATEADASAPGPIGAAGVPLTPDRSIAIDRAIWPYGLPFWIDADLPAGDGGLRRVARLTVGQDTGSAIVGPSRADLYFGSGATAGRAAGDIRHRGRMTVLLPKDAS